MGSRARCDGRPGATRRGAAPSENAEIQRRIRVSCGAAREPGKAGDDEDPSTSEPSMAPPTPTPVFSRRPLSARQRKILNERVLSRPPPGLGGANDGAPGSGLSLQASRQQAELFKGLTQQLSGLAALGLGNVPALEQWRKTSQEPEGRNEDKKAPRRCSCCGEVGHNKRSCPVAFQRDVDALTGKLTQGATELEAIGYLESGGAAGPSPEARKVRLPGRDDDDVDLEEYFEGKYRDFYERKLTPHPPAPWRVAPDESTGPIRKQSTSSIEREPAATDVEQRSRGRPKLYARVIQPATASRFGRAFRPKTCSVCGSPDHNKRWHDEKVAVEKKYPDSTRCSFCGEVGHNQRNCPKKMDKPSGYGYAYGYAYGHGYGERYGRGDSGRGEAGAEERRGVPVRRPRDKAPRDKAKELEAAELWLRSRARCPEYSRVSIKSACVRVGYSRRYAQNVYNRAKALVAAGWVDDGGDDACGLDEVNAPQTNPTLMSIDEEELAMQAAMDCIDDPDLLPGDAAVRRGLKRGQANWVGILRRKILDGGTIDRLPVKSATQTRYL